MKKIYAKTISFLLALIVLLSTMSFSLDMHFCGDDLVGFSFSEKSEKIDACMMKGAMTKTSSSCKVMVMGMEMKMDCCNDVEVVVEGQDYLKISFEQRTIGQQLFIAYFFYDYRNLFEGSEANSIPFKDRSPPPLVRDVQILHQTFLI